MQMQNIHLRFCHYFLNERLLSNIKKKGGGLFLRISNKTGKAV